MFLGEMLTLAAAVGCALILLAVVMVEAGPAILRELKFQS
jgi:uncharacterized membrane protein